MVGSNSEQQELTIKLVATAGAYGMEISTVKSKVMVGSTNNASVSIIMDSEILEEVSDFKYLGETLTTDGTCKAEICILITAPTAAMARVTRVRYGTVTSASGPSSNFRNPRSSPFSSTGVRPEHGPLRQKEGYRRSKIKRGKALSCLLLGA